ncbi:MAG: MFS transporter [Alphaproteobacteria bacterium]|nr:MFS transporter [Alphaproteobacteria bacterium]
MRFLVFDTVQIARVFAVRNFALYTSGSAFSQIGMWVQRVAMGWLLWDLTHSGVWLGALALAEFLPTMVVTPFGGVLSDRLDRRRVTITTQTLSAVLAFGLWGLTIAGLVAAWHVIAMNFLWGVLSAIQQSSRIALVPSLVPRDLVGQALAINSVSFNLARFVGPALAGALIAGAGIAWTFFVNAVSYLPVIYAMSQLNLPEPRKRTGGGFLAEMKEGFIYAGTHDAISTMMILMAVSALLTRATIELLPGFADAVFGRGASGLATFTSAGGLGAIVAGLWLAGRTSHHGLTSIAIAAVFGNATAIVAFALTGNFMLAVGMMALAGAAHVSAGTASQTLVQIGVPDAMRGRVMSIWLMINRGGPALGALGFGWASEHYGWGWPTVLGSTGTILVCAWAMTRRRRLVEGLERSAESAPAPVIP